MRRSRGCWSGSYFQVVGVKPILGQLFVSDEGRDAPGANPVVVLGESFWRNRLHADPAIVGTSIRVNRFALTVIAVSPRQFGGTSRGCVTALWVPLSMAPQINVLEPWMSQERKTRMLRGLARLKPAVGIEQARAEVREVARRLAKTYPITNEGVGATLWTDVERNAMRRPLQMLVAMCLAVLLITCVNVAILLLARSTARQQEIRVRLALGASRKRIVRQPLTESFVLGGLGAVVSLPLVICAVRLIRYFVPPVMGVPIEIALDIRMEDLGFAMLICAGAAVVAGLAPGSARGWCWQPADSPLAWPQPSAVPFGHVSVTPIASCGSCSRGCGRTGDKPSRSSRPTQSWAGIAAGSRSTGGGHHARDERTVQQ